jgi:carbon-monoxide dehydrogenase medium subunit
LKAFQYLAPVAPFEYVAPTSLAELFDTLEVHGAKARVIAGGTDIMIALKQRLIRPEVVVDLGHLRSELAGVSVKDGTLTIGAMTTYTEIERDQRVKRFARALAVAASQVGTYQIRNLGTIGGNIANASPAADSAPPLIALSAMVRTLGKGGARTIPAEDFFTGVKKTVLLPGEIVGSVEIPADEGVSSFWMRSARRNENVISVVSVAVASKVTGNRFGESRIALGAVAPTPMLAKEGSSALSGGSVSKQTIEIAAVSASNDCRPISDVRASADYRRHLVYVLTKRTIAEVVESAGA